MRIILDPDKKTITVPWNYQKKLDKMNKMIMQLTGDASKMKTFSGYVKEYWKEAIPNTYRNLIVGQKPVKKDKE